MKKIANAYRAMAPSSDIKDQLLTKGIPALLSDGVQAVTSDPSAAEDLLSTMLDLMTNDEPSCNFVKGLSGVNETLNGVEILAKEIGGQTQRQLLHLVNEIRRLLQQASSGALTLEEVHRKWSHRKETNGEFPQIAEVNLLKNSLS